LVCHGWARFFVLILERSFVLLRNYQSEFKTQPAC
jgi:hypothetical protein